LRLISVVISRDIQPAADKARISRTSATVRRAFIGFLALVRVIVVAVLAVYQGHHLGVAEKVAFAIADELVDRR